MKLNKIAAGLALLAPSVAMADPVSALLILAEVAGASAWIKAAIFVAGAVITSADARRKRRRAEAAARRNYNSQLQDRSVTTLRTLPPVQTIYGRCITGGALRAMFTTDKSGTRTNGASYTKPDALKHLVISFAEHECQTLHEVYIDGVPINLASVDGNGWVTTGEFLTSAGTGQREVVIAPGGSHVAPSAVTVLSAWDMTASIAGVGEGANMVAGSYTLTSGNTTINNTGSNNLTVTYTIGVTNSTVRVSYHLGTAAQTVDTYLNGVAPSQWTSNHRLRGIAYAVITLDLENSRFQGGPPNVTFDVSGKKLYDPRTATTAFSSNPALVVRDYLTGEHGYDCDTADVDDTYIIAAANACDALISLDVGGVVQTNQPKYTCNGVTTSEEDKEATLSELVGSMCGQAHYGAKWLVQAGAWTAPVMDLSESDLQGQISIQQADDGLDAIFNGVRGTYIANNKATPSEFDEYQNATFLSDDGEPLWEDVALPFTNNKARCRNIARIRMEQSRNGQVIRFPAKLKALPLQIGDRVRVTNAEFGFSLKSYRVTDWQSSVMSPVELVLQEDTSGTYDEADAASADPTPNTDLPNPWVVAALSSLAVSTSASDQVVGSNSMRAKVSWAAITDPYIASNGSVVVRWRTQVFDPPNAWRQVVVAGDETQAFLVGVVPGSYITVEAYAWNHAINAQGPRTGLSHSVQMIRLQTPASGMTLVNSGNCVQNGDTVIKVSGGGAWNGGMHSREGYVGGAYVDFTIHQNQSSWSAMVGLSDNPSASAGYADIPHAIYLVAGGSVEIYRSGALAATGIATFAAGDAFSIVFDGRSMRYLKNGAVFYQYGFNSFNQLYLDVTIFSQGGRVQGLRFGAVSNMVNGRNLLDPNSWVVGSSGTQPGFFVETSSGAGGSNTIVLEQLPDGSVGAVWQGISGATTGGVSQGGFRTTENVTPVDPTKMYRFSVWHRRTTPESDGVFYLGPWGDQLSQGSVYNIGGGLNTNPYFIASARNALVEDKWHLLVGFVFPSSYAGSQLNLGGVWDNNGTKISNGTDFRWKPGVEWSTMRTYVYDTTGSGRNHQYWGPRIELVDGSEPSIQALLAMGAVSGSNPMTPGNITVYMDDGSVDTVQIAADAATQVYYTFVAGNVTYSNIA